MEFSQSISSQLNIRSGQASAVIELLDAGNTLPFIARYRKEATGSLDEEQIRQIVELLEKLRSLEERRQTVLKSIEEQGKLTPELARQINGAATLTALEDLYQPYRPKRRTRATMAREKGLQGLADLILKQPRNRQTLSQISAPYINADVPDEDAAWQGARDIVAEIISDHAEVRRFTREKAMQWGVIKGETNENGEALDNRGVYQSYYEFECQVNRIRPHQVLALNRGESEKILRVGLDLAERDWQSAILTVFRPDPASVLASQLQLATAESAERLLLPAIERDVRRALSEKAELHAIGVFASNLRALLSQPPLAGQTVLGIDPGIRTGCKVAVVDPTGKLLDTATIYPHEPRKEWQKSIQSLAALIQKFHITLIATGNGTASRETEQLIADLIRQNTPEVRYVIASEAGASVYSASPLARSELPNLDVSLRGAVSIARRVQDPLAELVKIDPQSIGVGLYQHDVNQKQLAVSLAGVVESVVNSVGVDVNTASPALLNPRSRDRSKTGGKDRGLPG